MHLREDTMTVQGVLLGEGGELKSERPSRSWDMRKTDRKNRPERNKKRKKENCSQQALLRGDV